jgi:hypothetical protein
MMKKCYNKECECYNENEDNNCLCGKSDEFHTCDDYKSGLEIKKCYNKECEDYNEKEDNNCYKLLSQDFNDCDDYKSTLQLDTSFVPDKNNIVWVEVGKNKAKRILDKVFKDGTCACVVNISPDDEYSIKSYKDGYSYSTTDWQSFKLIKPQPIEKKIIISVKGLVEVEGKYLHFKDCSIKHISNYDIKNNKLKCNMTYGNPEYYHKMGVKWSRRLSDEPMSFEVEVE